MHSYFLIRKHAAIPTKPGGPKNGGSQSGVPVDRIHLARSGRSSALEMIMGKEIVIQMVRINTNA